MCVVSDNEKLVMRYIELRMSENIENFMKEKNKYYNKDKKHEYYENNKDKKLEYQKEYNEKNKEKIREYQKEYYEKRKLRRMFSNLVRV